MKGQLKNRSPFSSGMMARKRRSFTALWMSPFSRKSRALPASQYHRTATGSSSCGSRASGTTSMNSLRTELLVMVFMPATICGQVPG